MRRSKLKLAAVLCVVVAGCATGSTLDSIGTSDGGSGARGGASADASGGANAGGMAGSGGTSSGGTTGSGGASSGGTAGSSGASSGGTAGSGGACPTGEKSCGGICIAPTPGIGCSMTDCTPCPAVPDNSLAVCTGDQCDFQCNAGYTQSGNGCVPSGTGGTGGTSGTGGSGGSAGNPGCSTGILCTSGTVSAGCVALCLIKGGLGLCSSGCCVCI